MQTKMMYIELKSGYQDNGPAWIGRAEFSKTGRTVYFNGQAFKNISGRGYQGNYIDVITREEYWISGVKKNEGNRHWAGSGKIRIDRTVVEEFMQLKGLTSLNKNRFEVVDIAPTDKQKFNELANEKPENA